MWQVVPLGHAAHSMSLTMGPVLCVVLKSPAWLDRVELLNGSSAGGG